MTSQVGLFDEPLVGPGLDVVVHRAAFGADEARAAFAALAAEVPWHQDEIVLFGNRAPVPRLTAWFGDEGCHYAYSGIQLALHPWLPALGPLRQRVEQLAGTSFNSVLANRYRDGRDGVAWHADDEAELGPEPVIASISLGATRRFQLRRRDDRTVRRELDLHDGDVVVMRGTTQALWLHQVPKTSRPVGERINLTFRSIVSAPPSP